MCWCLNCLIDVIHFRANVWLHKLRLMILFMLTLILILILIPMLFFMVMVMLSEYFVTYMCATIIVLP